MRIERLLILLVHVIGYLIATIVLGVFAKLIWSAFSLGWSII